MEKSFKYYYKEGFKVSLKALKGLGIFKYLLLTIINVIASFLIIPIPLVAIINVRVAKNVRLDKRISFTKSLRSADEPIGIWNLILSMLISLVLFLGIVAIIGIFTLILFGIGAGIVALIDVDMTYATYFLIPGAIALVALIFSLPYIYIPVYYIIEENPKISMSKAMYNALYSLRQGGKLNIFFNELVFWPIVIVMTSVCFIPLIMADLLDPAYFGIIPIISSVIVLIVLFILPIFSLPYQVVKQNIYEDILADTYSGVKGISGINPCVVKKARKTNDLSVLFDNVEEIDEVPDLSAFEIVTDGSNEGGSNLNETSASLENKTDNQNNQALELKKILPDIEQDESKTNELRNDDQNLANNDDLDEQDNEEDLVEKESDEENLDDSLIEKDVMSDELKKTFKDLVDENENDSANLDSNLFKPNDKDEDKLLADEEELDNTLVEQTSVEDISSSESKSSEQKIDQEESKSSVDDILKQLESINDYEEAEDDLEESLEDENNNESRGE